MASSTEVASPLKDSNRRNGSETASPLRRRKHSSTAMPAPRLGWNDWGNGTIKDESSLACRSEQQNNPDPRTLPLWGKTECRTVQAVTVQRLTSTVL